jgi:hypothetical protein
LKYVAAFFGLHVPDTKVCVDHSTPAEFISDLFFERESLILAIANRSGYKTLLVAISNVLDMFFKATGIIHAGAIQVQANKGYGYVKKFCETIYGDELAFPPMMSRTQFKNGGHIEVAPMTMHQMAGPHEPKIRRDEVDLAKPDALEQSVGMASETDDTPISIVDISSRYFSAGNVQRMIDSAQEDGRKLHVWCYKETTQGCTDERSGTRPTTIYIDREALHAVTEQEYNGFSATEKDNYTTHRMFGGCVSCPIAATCCGDLKRAGGNQSIEEITVKYRAASSETWIAQYESRRALNEGVVFKHEWKPRYHVVSITAWQFPRNWQSLGFRLYRCLDFGRNRPSVGWVLYDPNSDTDTHFHELEPFDLTIEGLKVEIEKVDKLYGLAPSDITETWCDPAGVQRTDQDIATRIQRLNDGYNLKARIPARIGVWNGIDEVKRRLKIENGKARFIIVKENCPVTIRAMESYSKKKHTQTGLWLNEPADPQEYEHPIDRIRYYIVGRYCTRRAAKLVEGR